MFGLPDAKRVRRKNLYDSESEQDPEGTEGHDDAAATAAAQARLKERLSSLLSFDVTSSGGPAGPDSAPEDGDPAAPSKEGAEEAFEFRLFASRDGGAAASKVVLAPEAADGVGAAGGGEGGFVNPSRPLSYYLAGPPSAEEQERWRLSAVTGEEVLERSTQRSWGLEVPWRVVRIVLPSGTTDSHNIKKQKISALPETGASTAHSSTAPSSQPANAAASVDDGDERGNEAAKRKRPGKRKRIAMRIKAKKEEEEAKTRVSKEEHLQAKKKRLNREKKLKRRQKEKEKKLAARADGSGLAAADGPESGSESD